MIGALWTNSLALIIDAGHMLVDASGLLIALLAASLALRPPSPERTWGYRRAEVLAAGALFNRPDPAPFIRATEAVRRRHTADPALAALYRRIEATA